MPDISDDERRTLLGEGRALPPEPGRFPIRASHPDDIGHAAHDLNRVPESDRPVVRRHIVRWAVADGHTSHLPATWQIRSSNHE